MKKILLFSATLLSGTALLAQTAVTVPKSKSSLRNQPAKFRKYYDAHDALMAMSKGSAMLPRVTFSNLGTTTYQLQTNSSIQNRIVNNTDNTVSATWTFSNTSTWTDRGTGYVYHNGTSWSAAPTVRIEGERTGWPSMMVLGNGGEAIVSHSTAANNLYFSKRTTKGTGTWTNSNTTLANTNGPGNLWPRAINGGADGNSIHVISISDPVDEANGNAAIYYEGQQGALTYSRSQDGGNNWDIFHVIPAEHDSTQYVGFDGDSYAIDANGNTIAYVVGGFSTDLFLMKSTDNGNTWTKTVIMAFPIPMFVDQLSDVNNDGTADTIDTNDGSVAVLIDNGGECHVFAGYMRIMNDDTTDGSLSYFPGTNGLMYWNEGMGAAAPVIITGAVDIDGSGALEFPTGLPAGQFPWGTYQTSISSQPSAGIDANGDIYLSYAALIENTDDGNSRSYRNIYIIKSEDDGDTWTADPVRVMSDDNNEQVYASMARYVDVNCVKLEWQQDIAAGHGVGTGNADALPNTNVTCDIWYTCFPTSLDGVNENTNVIAFEMYPNPAENNVNLKIGLSNRADMEVTIFNTLGQSVYKKNYALLSGGNNININVNNFEKGIYLVQVREGNAVTTQKLVVE